MDFAANGEGKGNALLQVAGANVPELAAPNTCPNGSALARVAPSAAAPPAIARCCCCSFAGSDAIVSTYRRYRCCCPSARRRLQCERRIRPPTARNLQHRTSAGAPWSREDRKPSPLFVAMPTITFARGTLLRPWVNRRRCRMCPPCRPRLCPRQTR